MNQTQHIVADKIEVHQDSKQVTQQATTVQVKEQTVTQAAKDDKVKVESVLETKPQVVEAKSPVKVEPVVETKPKVAEEVKPPVKVETIVDTKAKVTEEIKSPVKVVPAVETKTKVIEEVKPSAEVVAPKVEPQPIVKPEVKPEPIAPVVKTPTAAKDLSKLKITTAALGDTTDTKETVTKDSSDNNKKDDKPAADPPSGGESPNDNSSQSNGSGDGGHSPTIKLPTFFDPPPPQQYETSFEVHVKKEKIVQHPKITRKLVVNKDSLEKKTEAFLQGILDEEPPVDYSLAAAQRKLKNFKHSLHKSQDTVHYTEDTITKAKTGDFDNILTPAPERKDPVYEYQYIVENPKTGECISTSDLNLIEDKDLSDNIAKMEEEQYSSKFSSRFSSSTTSSKKVEGRVFFSNSHYINSLSYVNVEDIYCLFKPINSHSFRFLVYFLYVILNSKYSLVLKALMLI